jgi:hypothetical protein
MIIDNYFLHSQFSINIIFPVFQSYPKFNRKIILIFAAVIKF